MEKLKSMVPETLRLQIAESTARDLPSSCSSLLDFFLQQPTFHQIVGDLTDPETALCGKNKEAAMEFKRKGNESFSKGDYSNALNLYSQALRVAPAGAADMDKNLVAMLYVNRAFVLHTRWEELAHHKPLSDFPMMGLFKHISSALLIHEAFATVDGDEWRCRLLPSFSLPEPSPIVLDQMAFVVSSGTRTYCQHCRKPGDLIDRCFDLYSELKQQFFRNRGGSHGRGTPRTGAIAEVEPYMLIHPISINFKPKLLNCSCAWA
ncbi:tetratricopeptide repeat (TPR)-like superfamily protein [Actinidia rufa]|uniref:Tetratricopeptide repeat (TPR)-like superfamily protein n=1 Tax=Actinidia rufa TaxID=165716 RepID=A0A7J0EF01_9ERIC|nr:tetratricopeptide repeat (TPR)-like superfamily protein [Actinidia rufa]